MRIKKLVMGLALGVSLLGAGNVASAKASTITVKVDKADSATAKKVDKALKQGKAVTLKVKGNKKSSKTLLIKLQDAVARANIFGARFDLDNGDEEYAGKGNVFQTYGHLSYKKSGNYGCYTITKSSANAYKYYLLGVNKMYKDQTSRLSKKAYNAYVEKMEDRAEGDVLDDIANKLCDFAEGYLEEHHAGFMTEALESACVTISKMVSGVGEVTADEREAMQGYFEKHKSLSGFQGLLFAEAESYASEVGGTSLDLPSHYEWAVNKVGKSAADYYFGKASYIDPRATLGFTYIGYIEYDHAGATDIYHDHDLFYGNDEHRLRELYKGTKGVCGEIAKCCRTCLDYIGARSYYVLNPSVNHALCVLNASELGGAKDRIIDLNNAEYRYGSSSKALGFGKEEFESSQLWGDEESAEEWIGLIKEAMGDDYPF